MTRRAPPITITITVDERNRVGTVVELLLTVSKNKKKAARSNKRKIKDKKESSFATCPSKFQRRRKASADRELTYDPKNIGSWQHGPFFCPSFSYYQGI